MIKVKETYAHSMGTTQVVTATKEAVSKLLESLGGTAADVSDDETGNIVFSCSNTEFSTSGKVFVEVNEINVEVDLTLLPPLCHTHVENLYFTVKKEMDKQISNYLNGNE